MDSFFKQKQSALIDLLRKNLSGEIRFDATSRRLYSTDASIYQIEPLGVVIPRTADDLLSCLQIAIETQTPIVPRGGGTSLSGQSIGPGLVVDCSKYLTRIGPVDLAGRSVRVQPGVVLDQLNRVLKIHGLQFGPDVATASRATLGGMIGNNSAGSRSILYGRTVDHIRSIRMILSDGTVETFSRRDGTQAKSVIRERVEKVTQHVLRSHKSQIEARFPRIQRRVSGYNLVDVLHSKPSAGAGLDLIPLLTGSEGTLGFTAEAELNLIPLPRHRGLLVPHFDSLAAALDALHICLEYQPSAVELLDELLIRMASEQRSFRHMMAAIQGLPAALFMVEFSSDDLAEVTDKVTKLQQRLANEPGVTALVPALDSKIRDPLWNLRSAAVPLLYGIPGDRKPATFVEDCAVAPDRLPEFASRFRTILQRHGTDGAFYGHASVGCLHIRPLLDLKKQEDIIAMRAIMEDVTDLVLDFGGALSGEHGDGLVRSEWNRKMFGPEVYEAFRQIKRAFDPDNLFNPGKIVDAPSMTENLRLGPGYQPRHVETVFDYTAQGDFFQSIELCNGAGVCRKTQGGAMCPSYRATRDEQDSTRGRANALRIALNQVPSKTEGSANDRPLADRWLLEVMDLCLSCKACKSECPSNVDMAKLKAEFQHAYYRTRLRPLSHYFVGRIHQINHWGSKAATLMNWLSRQSLPRWFLEKAAGIDRRRSLPRLHGNHFRKWFKRRSSTEKTSSRPRVLLLDDCFTTFNEPEIGQAAVALIEYLGYQPELVNPICCGRALISKGFLKEARSLAQMQLPSLAARLEAGTPILGMEPSCIATMLDEWPELVPGPEAERVRKAVALADVWIGERLPSMQTNVLSREPHHLLLHGHCHQRALWGVQGSANVLAKLPGKAVTTLDAGCCGMAGAFGYEHQHFDLSVQIANLELIPAIQASPEAVIVATGTSCRHQIRDLTGRHAVHPLLLMRDAVTSLGNP